MESIAKLLREATRKLQSEHLPEPRRDAELLLSSILGRERSFLLSHPEDFVSACDSALFREWVNRRAAHYPIQYLLGTQEFFGRPFQVDARVLIPRPETELLIETALELTRDLESPRIADVGTGSGCIAVTLACERADCSLVATDISPGALEVARANARHLGVDDRIDFRLGSLLEPVRDDPPFDLIASNPPYVADHDPRVTPEVALNEPGVAVFAGTTGLELHRELFRQAPDVLKSGGYLVIEIGAGQHAPVVGYAEAAGWKLLAAHRDLAGIERCLVFGN